MPLLALIFVFSGAAGLIYESVWARYISLLVGHSAYAQIIVLVIFLGGMAIGSLLVGIGLFSLWRTSPPPEGEGLLPRAAEVAGQVKETVQEWSAGAVENLTQIADTASATAEEAYASARDTMSEVKTHVTVAADQAAGSVQETMTHIRDQASAAGAKTSGAVRTIVPNEEARDKLLLGAAALAVAAAVGIAYQRRSADEIK